MKWVRWTKYEETKLIVAQLLFCFASTDYKKYTTSGRRCQMTKTQRVHTVNIICTPASPLPTCRPVAISGQSLLCLVRLKTRCRVKIGGVCEMWHFVFRRVSLNKPWKEKRTNRTVCSCRGTVVLWCVQDWTRRAPNTFCFTHSLKETQNNNKTQN